MCWEHTGGRKGKAGNRVLLGGCGSCQKGGALDKGGHRGLGDKCMFLLGQGKLLMDWSQSESSEEALRPLA